VRRAVVLITDGEVANPDQIIELAQQHAGDLRVFSFGIGYGASHHLVKGVARATAGAWEMIQPGERIQDKVLRQLARLTQPRMDSVQVELHPGKIEPAGSIPPVFEGDSVSIFARIEEMGENARFRFRGSLDGEPYSWEAPVIDTGTDDSIPCLWAHHRIRELKLGRFGGSNQSGRRQQAVEELITRLGVQFNLLTDYTSLVALEDRPEAKRSDGQPVYRRIPVLMTRDWHGTAFTGRVGLQYEQARKRKSFESADEYFEEPLQKLTIQKLGSLGIYKGHTRGPRRMERRSRVERPTPPPAPSDWQLELLGCQEPEGYFDCREFLERRLTYKKLEKRIRRICGKWGLSKKLDAELRERVVMTLIALRILTGAGAVQEISRRPVAKAKRWLVDSLWKHAVPETTIRRIVNYRFKG
jgi:hypothetical protein